MKVILYISLLTLFFVAATPSLLLATGAASSTAVSRHESLRTAIKQSFRVQYVLRDTKDTTLVQVMIQVDHPPTGMAFEMSARAGQTTWPLGPVAWGQGESGWWAYDTDLSEDIKAVDIVLTPSGAAAATLKREHPERLARLGKIWTGPPIVLPNLRIGNQEISMCPVQPLKPDMAREYALQHFEPTDPVVRNLKANGDWKQARAQLQSAVANHPHDAVALYDLGCLTTAEGDFATALKRFAELRAVAASPELRRRTQRQLRRLCAMELYRAKRGDPMAMCTLGFAYERGWGVGQVYQDAKYWYRRAANAGNAEAMRRLAGMYEHETGATVHTIRAHQWYRSQARMWYGKAAALGDEESKQWLSNHE